MEAFQSLQSSLDLDRNFTRPEYMRTLFLSQIEYDGSSGNFRAHDCIKGDFFGKHQRGFYNCYFSFVILLSLLLLLFIFIVLRQVDVIKEERKNKTLAAFESA